MYVKQFNWKVNLRCFLLLNQNFSRIFFLDVNFYSFREGQIAFICKRLHFSSSLKLHPKAKRSSVSIPAGSVLCLNHQQHQHPGGKCVKGSTSFVKLIPSLVYFLLRSKHPTLRTCTITTHTLKWKSITPAAAHQFILTEVTTTTCIILYSIYF